MDDFLEKVLNRTKKYEGFRNDVYIDTVGKATIGYGTNLDNEYISYGVQDLLFKTLRKHINNGGIIGKNWTGLSMSEENAAEILKLDLKERWSNLIQRLPFVVSLPILAQEILLDMCYNLGLSGLLGFKRFLTALQKNDYFTAGGEMLDSRWAKQVKRRAYQQAVEIKGLA